jgi:circadian clock protein KaiC
VSIDDRGFDSERLSTGHAQADEVLHGGFLSRTINVIGGMPGTGKTILAQQILFHNAGGARPVAYLSTLSEPLSKHLPRTSQFIQ